MTPKNDIIYDVVGIGNAIVDVLAKVGDGFLTERRLDKGAMTLLPVSYTHLTLPTTSRV